MPLEVRDIAVGAGRQQFMHTVSAGDQSAPPMVVLPGYGAGSGFFFRNVDGLAQHFRLHCVDLLGTGMSGVTHLPHLHFTNTSLPALLYVELQCCILLGIGIHTHPPGPKCDHSIWHALQGARHSLQSRGKMQRTFS
jgi:pimeloyl-ACP methyl ester carboxylesterase